MIVKAGGTALARAQARLWNLRLLWLAASATLFMAMGIMGIFSIGLPLLLAGGFALLALGQAFQHSTVRWQAMAAESLSARWSDGTDAAGRRMRTEAVQRGLIGPQ